MTHFRKLTAFLAAIVMSVSAMSLTAGAAQTHYWAVRYIPNSSGTNISLDSYNFTAKKECASAIDRCSNFSSNTDRNGRIAKVYTWGYITFSDTTNIVAVMVSPSDETSMYYEGTHTYSPITFERPNGATYTTTVGDKITIKHRLEQPTYGPVQCNMTGNTQCDF